MTPDLTYKAPKLNLGVPPIPQATGPQVAADILKTPIPNPALSAPGTTAAKPKMKMKDKLDMGLDALTAGVDVATMLAVMNQGNEDPETFNPLDTGALGAAPISGTSQVNPLEKMQTQVSPYQSAILSLMQPGA